MMKNLREKSIEMLCNFGKFGLGKSITLGMYDFEIPDKLISDKRQDNDNFDKIHSNNDTKKYD